eukprot:3208797-Amphidinium_carterae.1
MPLPAVRRDSLPQARFASTKSQETSLKAPNDSTNQRFTLLFPGPCASRRAWKLIFVANINEQD